MSDINETVYLIDDDESVRIGLSRLLKAAGMRVQTFGSATSYLAERRPDASGCVILDLSLPELSGLELQARLAGDADALPIIFLTAVGDVPTSVHAIKAGAVDFLMKPADDQALLAAIATAFTCDRERRKRNAAQNDVRTRLGRLSVREMEVMHLVAAGLLNKQIAAKLGTSEKTIKVHRAHLMQKLGIVSVAELVRLLASGTDSSQNPDRFASSTRVPTAPKDGHVFFPRV